MSEKVKTEKTGAFLESLKRNNSQIRADRAIAIGEQASLLYKRTVEDLDLELKQLMRDRDNMLDMSPTDANSLILASDFDAKDFIAKDLDLGIKIRNLKIKLEIATERYQQLFIADTSTKGEA